MIDKKSDLFTPLNQRSFPQCPHVWSSELWSTWPPLISRSLLTVAVHSQHLPPTPSQREVMHFCQVFLWPEQWECLKTWWDMSDQINKYFWYILQCLEFCIKLKFSCHWTHSYKKSLFNSKSINICYTTRFTFITIIWMHE